MLLTYKIVALFLVLIGASRPAGAADDDFGSAMLVGLGGAYAADADDPGVIWINPAVLSWASSRSGAALSYRKHFDLDALKEMDASTRIRVKSRWDIGGAFARYGETGLYLETRALAGVSREITSRWSAGAGVEYRRTEFGDGDVAYSGASLTVGIAGNPVAGVSVAGAVRRISLDGLYDDADLDPGVTTEFSAAWSAPPDITIGVVWTHKEGDDHRFGLGQRLRLVPGLEFISGLRFDPVRYTLGGRLAHGRGAIDYVYLSHADLGGTHTIGVAWHW